MELLQNILVYGILGAIQGFSEPIPISSSGHLVIFKTIFEHLGWKFPTTDITFEVLVNTGSLLAIMFYYRKDIARLFVSFFSYIFKADSRDEKLPDFRYCMLLIVATIPAAIGGVLFNLKPGFWTMLLAHITFDIPYVILSVLPKVRTLPQNIEEAAMDLGATPMYALRKVILPQIKPGIISGFLMAFTMSIDDFIISFFNTGNGVSNLSIEIYGMARRGIKPEINALSTIMFAVVLGLLLLSNRKQSIVRSGK